MEKNLKNLVPTIRHDRNRGSYMDADGNYVYITWEKRGRRWVEVPVCIIPRGENGENAEWIRLLALDDYAVDLQNRYHEEYVDATADIFDLLFPEEGSED